MTRSSLSLVLLAAMLACPGTGRAEDTVAPRPASPAPAPTLVMLADLRGEATPAYGYESWKDRLSRTADGVIVLGNKGAQGDGGCCGSPASPLDLSGAAYIEVALGVGQINEVPEVTIALGDADETQVAARIRIDQIVPQQPVWFRVPVAAFRPIGGKYAGKVDGMDWSKVAQWHLQGDWTTKKPFQAVFIAIRARS